MELKPGMNTLRMTALALAVGLGSSACAGIGNFASTSETNIITDTTIQSGSIDEGANIRYDDKKVGETGEIGNSCAEVPADTNFKAMDVKLSTGDESNGPWVGFPLKAFSTKIQNKCQNDKDGTLWVSEQYVHATINN